MIVFDITDRESFEAVKGWLVEIDKYGRVDIAMPKKMSAEFL